MNKEIKTIQHGKLGESYHCRSCDFSDTEKKGGCLKKAKAHCEKTGHTVDVYYESWREVTKNWS